MSRSYWLFYYNINLLFSSIISFFLKWQHALLQSTQFNLQSPTTERSRFWTLVLNQQFWSVKDSDENLTISSVEILLAAWSLLLSPRQEFLDNHLTRVPITPNQQGAFEMREEVLSSVGAQDTDTRGYEVSDLEDIEFSWEDPAVDMDSVYRPGIDTSFPIHLWRYSDGGIDRCQPNNSWRWGRQGEFSSNNNTRVWASNRSPGITENSSIWTRLENVLDCVYRTLFR